MRNLIGTFVLGVALTTDMYWYSRTFPWGYGSVLSYALDTILVVSPMCICKAIGHLRYQNEQKRTLESH